MSPQPTHLDLAAAALEQLGSSVPFGEDEPAAEEKPKPKRGKRTGSLNQALAAVAGTPESPATATAAAAVPAPVPATATAAAPTATPVATATATAPATASTLVLPTLEIPDGPLQGVARPNGELYYPRPLTAELTDVEAYRRCRERGKNIGLYGYPGTGKTASLEAAFNGELEVVEGNGDTEVRDLIGGYVQKIGSAELYEAAALGVKVLSEAQALALTLNGELAGKRVVLSGMFTDLSLPERMKAGGVEFGAFVDSSADYLLAAGSATEKFFDWQDGPVVIAAKKGHALLVDDGTLISPNVIAKLYPLMDGRGVIRLEQKAGGELVTAQPGFVVVLAHNPGAEQAVMSDPLASRLHLNVEVSSDFQLARRMGVDSRAVNLAETMRVERDHKRTVPWAPEMRELLNYRAMSEMFGDTVAARNLLAGAPEEAREVLETEMTRLYGHLGPLGLHG